MMRHFTLPFTALLLVPLPAAANQVTGTTTLYVTKADDGSLKVTGHSVTSLDADLKVWYTPYIKGTLTVGTTVISPEPNISDPTNADLEQTSEVNTSYSLAPGTQALIQLQSEHGLLCAPSGQDGLFLDIYNFGPQANSQMEGTSHTWTSPIVDISDNYYYPSDRLILGKTIVTEQSKAPVINFLSATDTSGTYLMRSSGATVTTKDFPIEGTDFTNLWCASPASVVTEVLTIEAA